MIRSLPHTPINHLYSIEDEFDYALVGPSDSRIHELRTTSFPYRTICHLERDFGGGKWAGCTGTLLTPNLVLTAAHCLFSHLRGGAPRRVRVSPGRRDRKSKPFGSRLAYRYFVPRGFIYPGKGKSHQRRWYDYGLIILENEFPRLHTFMSHEPLSRNKLKTIQRRGRITIAGYPADRPKGTLWRHSEKLKRITPRRLLYSVDTCPGHSGSPIWFKDSAKNYHLIGVHTSGILDEKGRSYGCAKGTVLAPSGLLNSGIRINTSVFRNIITPMKRRPGNEQMVELP